MTYKLDLEEQDSSTDLVDSCVYNIIDGDELTIEPVNITINMSKNHTTALVDENEITFDIEPEKPNNNQTIKVIMNKLNGNSESCSDPKSNYVSLKNILGVFTFCLIKNKCRYFFFQNIKKELNDLKRSANKCVMDDKRKSKKMKIENDVDDEKPSLIVKNGKVVYICGVCDFEAESMNFLLSHRARVHVNTGNYKCSECPTHYKTAGLLRRHFSMHHDFTHVCTHCDKRFSNKQGLDRHISCTHNNIPLEFQCVKCPAYFDTMEKMEDHLVVHYINPSNTFICNHCDRSFTTFAAKNKHIDLEHMVEIECSICHVVLPTKEAMDKHNNSVHQPKKKENKTYACTTCGKYFSGIKDVLSHRETHLPNKL